MDIDSTPGRGFGGATVAALVLGLAGCTTLSPEAQTAALIARAEAAMGSAGLKTLSVTGHGSAARVGQALAPGMAWPGLHLRAFSHAMNFDAASFREEFIRSPGGSEPPPPGTVEERGVVLARGAFAWDLAGTGVVSAPAALPARMHDLWLGTPQGAIQAATRLGARAGVRRAFLQRWDTLSFSMPGRFTATLVLEDTGLISRIDSTIANDLLGELPVRTEFFDYRPHHGLAMPARIVQAQGGHASLDLHVTAVVANESVEITIPDNVRASTESVSVEKVAEHVWFLAGGTHHSVAIEQAGQIVLVELPLSQGHSRAVMDAANRLAPGKRVATVINTHHHFDQAGGLRVAVAEGATVYTSAVARPFFDALFAARPAAASGRPDFRTVDAQALLDDPLAPIHVHEVAGSPHARGLLMVWLPHARLLVQADAYTPSPATAPRAPDEPPPAAPAAPDASHLNLVQNLDRLGLAPRLILPLHGHIVPAAELYARVGRKPPP